MLSRSFQTSFYITIVPVNDNRPVIRLFTSGNCSFNSTTVTPSRKRSTAPQESKRIKHHSAVQQEHQMVNSIYGIVKRLPYKVVTIYRYRTSLSYMGNWPTIIVQLILSYISLLRCLILMLTSGQDCRLCCHYLHVTLVTSGLWVGGMTRIL